MNGKTKECRTGLSKELLNVAVGRMCNLGPHKSSMNSPMSTFSIKERKDFLEEIADVSVSMAFFL